jgi:hypothetical protein
VDDPRVGGCADGPCGEADDRADGPMVSVRIARILAGREVAICLDRPFSEPWMMGVEDARRLHRDLGEALGSLSQLGPEEAR